MFLIFFHKNFSTNIPLTDIQKETPCKKPFSDFYLSIIKHDLEKKQLLPKHKIDCQHGYSKMYIMGIGCAMYLQYTIVSITVVPSITQISYFSTCMSWCMDCIRIIILYPHTIHICMQYWKTLKFVTSLLSIHVPRQFTYIAFFTIVALLGKSILTPFRYLSIYTRLKTNKLIEQSVFVSQQRRQ